MAKKLIDIIIIKKNNILGFSHNTHPIQSQRYAFYSDMPFVGHSHPLILLDSTEEHVVAAIATTRPDQLEGVVRLKNIDNHKQYVTFHLIPKKIVLEGILLNNKGYYKSNSNVNLSEILIDELYNNPPPNIPVFVHDLQMYDENSVLVKPRLDYLKGHIDMLKNKLVVPENSHITKFRGSLCGAYKLSGTQVMNRELALDFNHSIKSMKEQTPENLVIVLNEFNLVGGKLENEILNERILSGDIQNIKPRINLNKENNTYIIIGKNTNNINE